MSADQVIQDFLSRQPPKDNSQFNELVKAIKESSVDTESLISLMTTLIKSSSESKPIPAPDVKINFDVASLIKEIRAIPERMPTQEMKAPSINLNTADLAAAFREREANDAISYEVDIKRGTNGKIVKMLFSPVR